MSVSVSVKVSVSVSVSVKVGLPWERVEPQTLNPRLLLDASWTSSPTNLWLEFPAASRL